MQYLMISSSSPLPHTEIDIFQHNGDQGCAARRLPLFTPWRCAGLMSSQPTLSFRGPCVRTLDPLEPISHDARGADLRVM